MIAMYPFSHILFFVGRAKADVPRLTSSVGLTVVMAVETDERVLMVANVMETPSWATVSVGILGIQSRVPQQSTRPGSAAGRARTTMM